MHDDFDYSQLNCRWDDDVIATTPSFGQKMKANVFSVGRKVQLCTWYWADVHNFTSPQNDTNSIFSSPFTYITSWWNFLSVLVNARVAHGIEIVRCQHWLYIKSQDVAYRGYDERSVSLCYKYRNKKEGDMCVFVIEFNDIKFQRVFYLKYI